MTLTWLSASGLTLEDPRVRSEMDCVDVTRVGLDGVVVGSNRSDCAHQAASHHAGAASEAAVAAALAVATA